MFRVNNEYETQLTTTDKLFHKLLTSVMWIEDLNKLASWNEIHGSFLSLFWHYLFLMFFVKIKILSKVAELETSVSDELKLLVSNFSTL